jgi:multiple sugar transport system substrate-binding protein
MQGERIRAARLGAAVAAGALLATVVAACGGGGSSAPSGGSATGGSSGGKVTLQVWDWGSPSPSSMKALDADYMKAHPNVTIKRTAQPFNSYFTLERSAIASKKGPDIFIDYASPALFDYQQGLLPLKGQLPTDLQQNLIGLDLVSTSLNASGTPYAVPWTGQGELFYYNKSLFKKAGLDPEKPPTTWDELIAACKKLKAAGTVPIVAGFKDGYYAEWWGDLFASQFLSKDTITSYHGTPKWTDPAMAKGLDYMRQLYKAGYMTPNSEGVPLFPDTVNAFGANKGAMIVGLAANNANWSEFSKAKVAKDPSNLGVFKAPMLPGATGTPAFDFGPGLAWAVTKWSQHQKEAIDYLSFISSGPEQAKLFKLSGAIPNNRTATPSSSNPSATEILGWTRGDTFIGPFTTIRSNVETAYDRLIPQYVTGQISADDMLKQMDAEQQKAPPVPTQ